MHQVPALQAADYIGPAAAALVFIVIMSMVKEPARRTVNAILTAGLTGIYISGGGFGIWELLFPVVTLPMAYAGLRSYRFSGLAWLLHSCWDIVHHLYGNALWPFMPTSSFGCMIFDAVIAIWFFADAPSVFRRAPAF